MRGTRKELAAEAGIIARETGALRRELRDTLLCGAGVCLESQAAKYQHGVDVNVSTVSPPTTASQSREISSEEETLGSGIDDNQDMGAGGGIVTAR